MLTVHGIRRRQREVAVVRGAVDGLGAAVGEQLRAVGVRVELVGDGAADVGAVPCNVAVSVTLEPMPTVIDAAGVTFADDCVVVMVGDLQFENAIGPAKSLSTAVNDCDERVCGRNVLMQPWKPAAARSMPPSMNAFWASVVVLAPLELRQTQPPHVIAVAPELTPNDAMVTPRSATGPRRTAGRPCRGCRWPAGRRPCRPCSRRSRAARERCRCTTRSRAARRRGCRRS